ncbi:MAG: hypothetical protein A3G34_12970 [Candidatus Lindowbacteria bacterium RIFCSPLOWO2_12_FULL_62_27]|nr:MAG: hypothetical protein A3I06_15085 [Candidatus Lindowbacteria bacterium RIFCSPLOWO2_02_FULL_62_12]OGH62499.1 MAG: hypothetical protein A3G34_12970 [Candidatus Lindowbacteria bacterium RIFCSPLOWO2_12_FULL_62_27]
MKFICKWGLAAASVLAWPAVGIPEPILGPVALDVGEYRVGVGDVLRIRLYDGKETSEREVRVRPDGKISFDMIGSVHVRDFTPTQISEVLKLRLKKYYRQPDVTVFVEDFVSQKVLVIGNVKIPGTYPLMGDDRILDVLARAGWVSKPAVEGADQVVLLRAGAREPISLSAILNEAKMDMNRSLHAGDVIYVIASGEKGMVRVQGEVRAPGKVWIERTPTWVTDVLTSAGGLTDQADPARAFMVRPDGSRLPVDLSQILNGRRSPADAPELKDGDLLFVPPKLSIRVFVLGMVRSPGAYDLPAGSHVLAAMARAGYHVPGAVLDSTRVVRVSPTGQTQVFTVALERLVMDRQVQNDMELSEGDVIFVPKSVISNLGDFWEKFWPLVRVNIQNVQSR